ncbi:TetR/AcrR family transcriptional regulator [Arthrobacter sp. NPDC090010]|uniref:TetR/AcrR family transcriptional regulator n=1 Tax=Arthrobacter sp. NPDC090010 TaxID=3363942 RepID=UPI0037F546E9
MPAQRSSRATEKIQDAAWEIFMERGLPGVSIEEIAGRAGVAKTTVYRWWPNKSAVLMDALSRRLAPKVVFEAAGSAREDVMRQIELVIELFNNPVGRGYLSLIAESTHDAELADALRERYIAGRREAAVERLRRGVEQGELPAETDLEMLVDSLYGALYYNALVAHAPLDKAYAARLIKTMWPTVQ